MYTRQIVAAKASVVYLTLPAWFKLLAKNALIFASPFQHFGNAWGKVGEEDGNTIEIHTSRGGAYNVLIVADRADKCATTMCPQELEYIPQVDVAYDAQSLP